MQIIAQKRVGNRILHHIRAIAFPRFTGTNGERKAQAYIRNTFQSAGYIINEQEFTSSLFPLEILPRISIAIVCSMIVIAFAILPHIPALSIELSILSLLFMVFGTRWNVVIESLYRVKKFGIIHSKNIIATHPHQQNHINVVFTAHYDSKSQTFSGVTRFFFYSFLTVSALLSIAGIITRVFITFELFYLMIFILPMCTVGLLLQFNSTHNRSIGAYDNASGVGIILELASTFSQENPGVNLAFVATGAEEAGLCGAVALMRDGRFLEHFPPSRTIIINIDGVGCDGPVRVTDRYGVPPVKTGRLVSELCVKIGERFGIKTKRNWMPAGAAMDHIPFASHGYQTVTLSTAKLQKTFHTMHTKRDVVDNISVSALEHCYAIAQEIVDSIPTTQYLASTN